jgi:hypothetical protein
MLSGSPKVLSGGTIPGGGLLINTGGTLLSPAPFTCTTSPDHCYAVHRYTPFSAVNGVKSTNKVLYMTGTTGTITGATWAILNDGTVLETDWQEQVSGDKKHYFVWGLNTNPQPPTWGTPSDNTYYTFRVEDTNQDKIWHMSVDGVSGGGTYTAVTTLAHILESGYEIDPTTSNLTLLEDDFKNLSYVYNGTWNLWDSAHGAHDTPINPIPLKPLLHVKYCGVGDENYYHSQHGPGSAPANCS